MSQLTDKIENALNEGRILLLGAQVLIGASFRSIFSDKFDRLPSHSQAVMMASLWTMTIGLALLLLPAPYHFLAERGENSRSFHELVTSILEWALLPFAGGLGVSVFVTSERLIKAW